MKNGNTLTSLPLEQKLTRCRNRRSLIINICIILVLLVSSVGCSKEQTLTLTDNATELTSALEYGEYFNFEKVVDDEDYLKLIVTGFDGFKVGSQTITLEAIYEEDARKSTTLDVTIVDTNYPKFEAVTKDFRINQYEPLDIRKFFKAYDLVDGDVDFELLDTVDTGKAGTTTVYIRTTDGNGLKTVHSFTLDIAAVAVPEVKPPVVTPPTHEPSEGENEWEGNPNPETPSPVEPVPEPPAPSQMRWMFADGYNIQTGFAACEAVQAQSGGSCVRILADDNSGLTVGYELQ